MDLRSLSVPSLLGHHREMPDPALQDTLQDKTGRFLPVGFVGCQAVRQEIIYQVHFCQRFHNSSCSGRRMLSGCAANSCLAI